MESALSAIASDHREQLVILVTLGKTKEFVGRLMHNDVDKMNGENVDKFHKQYEAALASRVT